MTNILTGPRLGWHFVVLVCLSGMRRAAGKRSSAKTCGTGGADIHLLWLCMFLRDLCSMFRQNLGASKRYQSVSSLEFRFFTTSSLNYASLHRLCMFSKLCSVVRHDDPMCFGDFSESLTMMELAAQQAKRCIRQYRNPKASDFCRIFCLSSCIGESSTANQLQFHDTPQRCISLVHLPSRGAWRCFCDGLRRVDVRSMISTGWRMFMPMMHRTRWCSTGMDLYEGLYWTEAFPFPNA